MILTLLAALAVILLVAQFVTAAETSVDLGPVIEKHEMVPMRDGKRLSTYVYFPRGKGPWPVIYEQRYADLRSAGSRRWVV